MKLLGGGGGGGCVKLLGIKIDNKLDFTEHVSSICKMPETTCLRQDLKIHDNSIQDKLQILNKAFIESQFGYCLLIYGCYSVRL